MSVSSVLCPYCGLPSWKRVEKVLNNTKRFLIVNLCQCENCGKMFYMCRTRMFTFTVKLEDVSQEELLELETKSQRKPEGGKQGRKRKRRAPSKPESKPQEAQTQTGGESSGEKVEEKS